MVEEIRPMTLEEVERFTQIATESYCGFGTAPETVGERRAFLLAVAEGIIPIMRLYGAFRGGVLLGGMILVDYTLRYFSATVPVGGVRTVAVDPVARRQGVARALVAFACRHFRERGRPLVALHPFRTDFYRNLGFGFGVEIHRFSLRPEAFPEDRETRPGLGWLSPDDAAEIVACSDRALEGTRGSFVRHALEIPATVFFRDRRGVGWRNPQGELEGYAIFAYRSSLPFRTDLDVAEMAWATPRALRGLSTFFRGLGDQIGRIGITIQDEAFPFLLADPSSGETGAFGSLRIEVSTVGVGVMYRAVDVRALWQALGGRVFGEGALTVRFDIRDPVLSANDGPVTVRFERGRGAAVKGSADLAVTLEVGDFSSLLLGAVSLSALVRLGRAVVSDETLIPCGEALFRPGHKPRCLTDF